MVMISFMINYKHNRVVNAIIDGIKSKRVSFPVGRRNNNLPTDGKILDVEFQKNGETWVLDVRFTSHIMRNKVLLQIQINISLCIRIELFLL